MTGNNFTWGHKPKTDFPETPVDEGMFNLHGIWPDDDPHPLHVMAKKADKFVLDSVSKQSADGFAKEYRNAMPALMQASAKTNSLSDFGLKPASNTDFLCQ